MMNKKKVVLWAGVLFIIPTLIFAGLAGSVQQSNIDIDEDRLLMRLQIFELMFYRDYESYGCNRIYDVSRNRIISMHDCQMCWRYIVDDEHQNYYGNLLFDVNCDGQVNFQDAGLIWVNRD